MLIVVVALVAGGLSFEARRLQGRDSDRDGLSDVAESLGWRTLHNGVYVTDPDNPDTDGDGLPDGVEGGARTKVPGRGSVYLGVSSPLLRDSDGDKIGDADEYALDLNPRSRDTDDDTLTDDVEMEFGSDPTLVNADDDSYDDKDEYERESDPLSYDLTLKESSEAFGKGLIPGDFGWASKGLNEAQLASIEFLVGQMVGDGVVPLPIAKIRDDLARGDYVEACLRIARMLTPYSGAIKVSGAVAKQAGRGATAARVAYKFFKSHGSPTEWTREDLLDLLGRGEEGLPLELEGGPSTVTVYVGRDQGGSVRLAGLSADLPSLQATVGGSLQLEALEDATSLSRGQAMAIVEVLDARPGVHTIDPEAEYYDQAAAWGKDWLTEHGHEIVGERPS